MHFAACCGLLLGVVHGLMAVDLRVTPGLAGLQGEQAAPWTPGSASLYSR